MCPVRIMYCIGGEMCIQDFLSNIAVAGGKKGHTLLGLYDISLGMIDA